MPNRNATYVGFGFGAIQAGLFLYEAQRSGAFGRLVVAEVLPEVVSALRRAGGRFTLNIAHADRVEQAEVGPVEILDVSAAGDRERLVEALADASEISTAVPGVGHYVAEGPGSLHRLLAEGLQRKATRGGPPAVVYAAENHNRAAEILEAHVLGLLAEPERTAARQRVRFLNTVIGKMSGAVTDADEICSRGLAPVTPGESRALLVEAFNRILISRIGFGDAAGETAFRRGITVFEEKADLLPFEEAKLYGHNATHALAAYIAALLGAQRMADLAAVPGAMEFLRAAFVEESGEALIRKHRGTDPLFTAGGYRRYADDLLQRMINPFLGDTVERVARHVERKLGWDDRLIGTIRLALGQSVEPRRYAFGAAAALAYLDPAVIDRPPLARTILPRLWGDDAPRAETPRVLELVENGLHRLSAWRRLACPPLNKFILTAPDDA